MNQRCKEFSHRKNSPLTPFEQEVEAVLNHFHDPTLLGECSVLTAPYLLHEHLASKSDDPTERGRVLCGLLKTLVDENRIADPYEPPRFHYILQKYYFAKRRPEVEKIASALNLTHNPFNQSRSAAIRSLSKALIGQLQPALRLESPPQMTRKLIGRDGDLARCTRALHEGRSVVVTGNSGLGKTSLASHIAHAWDRGRVFWYTFRPGFNDQFTSFVFALGYFCHLCGESTLWREVLAQTGAADPEKTTEIARNTLAMVAKQQTPLLCFDEVDVLDSGKPARPELIQFIDNLRAISPTLIIGQHAVLDAPESRTLAELTMREMDVLLINAGIQLDSQEQLRLHTFTSGNPRLLELFVVLHEAGASFDEIFSDFASASPLEILLRRTLQRLHPSERDVMKALSVYRTPAPLDHWQNSDSRAGMQTLISRRLAHIDDHGGVELLPAYRQTLEKILNEPGGVQEHHALHRSAVDVWLNRGNYTEAIFHLICANERAQALALWYDQRQIEINQGRAAAALHLLDALDAEHDLLSSSNRETLQLCRSELLHLHGHSQSALEGLRKMVWGDPIHESEARNLEGVIENDLSHFGAARNAFKHGIARSELLNAVLLAKMRKGLSWAHLREGDMEWAMREAQHAQYEVDNLMGIIFEFKGEYDRAEQHYRTALGWADMLNHEEGVAKTGMNLSGLFARLGQFHEAKQYLSQAIESTAKIGRQILLTDSKLNAAFVYNLAGEYENALEALQEARDHFARFTSQIPADSDANIHQNSAEAYLGLGMLDEAEQNARQAISLAKNVEADATRTLAEIFLARGELDQAKAYVLKAIDLTQQEENNDPYLAGYAWRILAKIESAQGNHAASKKAKHQAILCFDEIKLPNEVDRTNRQLPDI